jgi:hypothetical protein
MAVVTENWRENRLSRTETGWTATRVFIVTEVSNHNQASSVVPGVSVGASHPLNAILICRGIDSDTDLGPMIYRVVAHYDVKIASAGAGGGSPYELEWAQVTTQEPTNTDRSKIPIRNSAGGLVDGLSAPEVYLSLRVTRDEPFYNVGKSLAYANSINSDSFTIVGAGTVGPGECYCGRIAPVNSYPANAKSVRVAYDFELKPRDEWEKNNNRSPFDHNFVDAATVGNWKDGDTIRRDDFYYSKGHLARVSEMVCLNGWGVPLNKDIKVGATKKDAVFPSNIGIYPAGRRETSDAWVLYYPKFKSLTFAGLL